MKKLLLLMLFVFTSTIFSQTLVHYYEFPRYNSYNSFWGITEASDTFWIGSDYEGLLYKVTKQGVIRDSLVTPFNYNHGLEWDGTDFWIAEQFRTAGARIYKITTNGTIIDSIYLPSLIGGASGGVGDIALDGNSLWFSIYSPDFTSYPFAYAYEMDITSRTIIDTIPLRGRQVQGITVKGDTIFYVNEAFHSGDPEKIYAYSKITGDTVMAFDVPDPDQDCNPRGLYWDGELLWLIADRIGNNQFLYRALYAYDIFGAGTPVISTINAIDFDDVIIGSPENYLFNVNNNGTGTLFIDSMKIDNALFTVSPVANHDTINPGAFKDYTVTFNPVAYGNQVGTLSIYSNAPGSPVKTISLSARGIFGPAHISFSESPVNFGAKRINSTSYKSIIISNEGSGNLTIDSVRLAGVDFYLQNLTTPVTIDSVSASSFRVWFNPETVSAYGDSIVFYSNASNGAVRSLLLNGNGIVTDTTLGTILWEGVIPDNPATTFDDLTIRSMRQIQDITGDGVMDLIVASENYWTIAYNGNSSGTSDIIWMFSSYPNNNNAGSVDYIQGLQIASDLNSDGVNDVVIGTGGGNEFVYALNGLTGEKLWEHGDSINFGNGDIMGLDVSRDFNGDGVPDVLANASGNESTGEGRFSVLLLDGRTGSLIWTINQAAQQKLKYMVAATETGGAAGSRVGTLNEVIGFDKQGNIKWIFPTTGTPWTVYGIEDIGGSSVSDVIVGTTTGLVYALSGDSGNVIWSRNLGNVFIEDLRITTDITANGKSDILVSGINPNIFLLEGTNGDIIWQNGTGGNILGINEIGDIDGDGLPDMVTSSLNNAVHIWQSRYGTQLFQYLFGGGGTGTAAEHTVKMDDIDGNGSFEFTSACRTGRIVAFSGGSAIDVPVEMTTFAANANGNSVTLSWSTATELNNRGFYVERRSDVSAYKEIGFVEGHGSVTNPVQYQYADKNLTSGKYFYRLRQTDFDGSYEYSIELEVNVGLPIDYSLDQNYPNPFNPSTKIKYSIPTAGTVKLVIYNLLGEQITTLVNQNVEPGFYTVEWNGTNNFGVSVPSGIYFYRIESGNYVNVKKMLMVK
ncbi:MAG: choice-of-anchor D domain-containing protein [Ignavibacteriales bacterium]|nr:MAG: choice-of-anchor D domain-containing protein [Ignavibacteriales bacterium]